MIVKVCLTIVPSGSNVEFHTYLSFDDIPDELER